MGTPGTDRHSVRGSLALLERPGHGRAGALLTPVAHVGVYRVDFRPFGFSPSMDSVVPEFVASIIRPDTVTALVFVLRDESRGADLFVGRIQRP